MGRVKLTIDDIPEKVTKDIVDYLTEKNIPVVMFTIGQELEKDMDTVIYALKHGITVGNHSYTHPHFDELTYEEAVEEIEKTEKLLEKAYELAGVKRDKKLFRFPYLNKGGANKERLQKYLRDNGYDRLDDSKVLSRGYIEKGLNKDIDVTCSFDIMEYLIPSGEMTFDEVISHIKEGDKDMESNVITDEGENIVLFHSHDATEALHPGYYKKVLDYMLDNGVMFV